MRQILILAIESDDALDIDHMHLTVPAGIDKARAFGTLLTDPMNGRAVADAAKACLDKLPTDQNVPVHPEMSRGDHVAMGLRLLAGMMETLDDLDLVTRNPRRFLGEVPQPVQRAEAA